MVRDPIVEEVRRLRHQTEAACENDWDKLVEHYRQVEKHVENQVIQGSPRRVATARTKAPQ